MKDYSRGRHTVFYHRYHLVWITKYRYRVMNHEVKKRVRELVAQVAEEIGVNILNGVVSSDHVHIFAEIPPHIQVSEFVKGAKGRSSGQIQQEFPQLVVVQTRSDSYRFWQ